MALIGMTQAAHRAGASRSSIKRTLDNAGITVIRIHPKAFAVEEADLETFLAKRPEGYVGRGRPPGAKNKPKEMKAGDGADEWIAEQ